jgi:hypothetical protein
MPCFKNNDRWELDLKKWRIAPGSYTFKFIIDGQWMVNDEFTKQADSNGNVNNWILIPDHPVACGVPSPFRQSMMMFGGRNRLLHAVPSQPQMATNISSRPYLSTPGAVNDTSSATAAKPTTAMTAGCTTIVSMPTVGQTSFKESSQEGAAAVDGDDVLVTPRDRFGRTKPLFLSPESSPDSSPLSLAAGEPAMLSPGASSTYSSTFEECDVALDDVDDENEDDRHNQQLSDVVSKINQRKKDILSKTQTQLSQSSKHARQQQLAATTLNINSLRSSPSPKKGDVTSPFNTSKALPRSSKLILVFQIFLISFSVL